MMDNERVITRAPYKLAIQQAMNFNLLKFSQLIVVERKIIKIMTDKRDILENEIYARNWLLINSARNIHDKIISYQMLFIY
jgi:hypothetical protein